MGLIDDKHAMLGGDHGFLGRAEAAGELFGRGRRRKYRFGEIRLQVSIGRQLSQVGIALP